MAKDKDKTATSDDSGAVAVIDNAGGGLSPVQLSQFMAVRPDSGIAETLAANFAEGESFAESDLTCVKTPSDTKTTWTIDDVDGLKEVDAIEGLLVYQSRGGVIWPTDDPIEGTLPLIRTDDMVTGYLVDENCDDWGDIDPASLEEHRNDDGTFRWADLPQTQFGSGKKGVGKRAQEYRNLCILRKDDIFPLLIRAKSGSIKTIDPFRKRLRKPYWYAFVSLTLKTQKNSAGQNYAQIQPKLMAKEDGSPFYIDASEAAIVKRLYTDMLAKTISNIDIVAGSDDTDADGFSPA